MLVIALFVCFWSTLKGLMNIWTSDDDYSYAFLLPLLSAYLLWERRKDISAAPVSTNWWGMIPFAVFMGIAAYGILGSSPSAARPAIPFVILSVTLLCFGSALFRVLAFPLSLLFFMVPLPTVVQTWIGVPLKTVSTKLGELMLRLGGVPVYVEGNIIDLGVTQLQVVDACSGLRYILPLMAIGVIFAYFFEKVRWKQVVLVFLTIPISIITNGFRIGMTGILTQWYGAKAAEGFFHDFSGWLIFVFAFILLFASHFVMKLVFRDNQRESSVPMRATVAPISSVARNNTAPVVAAAVVLLLVGSLGLSAAALPALTLKGGFAGFPMSVGDWKARTEALDSTIVRLSGAEEALNLMFTNHKAEGISLYVGYRGSPFLESENFFHSPSVCIPSSGWKVLEAGKHRITGMPDFGDVEVSKMVIEKMGARRLVYYWFQTKNRLSDDVNINRLHLSLHAITRDNTYDLFIRPIAEIAPSESIGNAESRLDGFVREIMPVLLQYLKGNQVQMQYSRTAS